MKSALSLIMILCFARACAQVSFKGYEHLLTSPLQHTIFQTSDSLIIDGHLNEDSWRHALWSSDFIDIEGNKRPAPAYSTRVKMVWDDQHLYIAAELQEPHIWATLQNHDQVVFHDNDFEVFIDPDGDTHNYFEIEVNALGTIFDLFLNKPYRNYGNALTTWDVKGLRTAISIEGTLNDAKDLDKKWVIEMAIPFQSLNFGRTSKPKDSTVWRMNFSRVQWDTDAVNGVYTKKRHPATGKVLPEHNWVWSPQGLINMHYPERWGYVTFSTKKIDQLNIRAELSQHEKQKKYLWLVYYKQHDFFKKHGRYATLLRDIGISSTIITQEGGRCTVHMEATANQFIVKLKHEGSKQWWHINHEGLINKIP